MKKKLLILIIAIVVVVASVVALVLFVNRDTTFKATTLAEVRKTLTDDSPACLKSADSITIDKADETGLENVVVSSITDVPAGTNVDVQFATYSKTEATGSAKYPGTYGSYNYVARKVSATDTSSIDYFAGWRITSFVPCKG